MNRHIQRLGIALVLCYLAVFVKLHQTQLLEVDELSTKPDNHRPQAIKYNKPRGKIVSADGALLAQSIDVGGNMNPRRRQYPEADLFAHVTGYYSGVYGSEGVEKRYDEQLRGDTVRQQFDGLANLFAARENVGNVTLTLRKDLQEAARNELGFREGAVVMLDPRTGGILALYSNPSYNPQLLNAVGSDTDLAVSAEAWKQLNADPARPMVSKAYREHYNPGSTFKAVVAGVGLQAGKVNEATPSYPVEDFFQPKGMTTKIANFGDGRCGGALPLIMTVSCNSAFMRMGLDIGGSTLVGGANAFGWNQKPPIDLPNAVASQLPDRITKEQAETALASIGQQHNRATPLEMALVAAAAGNGGQIMEPHVMKDVRNSDATVVQTYESKPWLAPLTPENAEVLKRVLYGPVNSPGGSATGRIRMPAGIIAGGKTGTAETGGKTDPVHTWFMGFAGPAGQPAQVAMAVVVLNQENRGEATGGQVAAPIANVLLNKALEVSAQPETDVSSVIRPTTTTTTPLPGQPAPGATPVTPGLITVAPVGGRRD